MIYIYANIRTYYAYTTHYLFICQFARPSIHPIISQTIQLSDAMVHFSINTYMFISISDVHGSNLGRDTD